MRASYNGNTLASQASAVGSIPIARSTFLNFTIHFRSHNPLQLKALFNKSQWSAFRQTGLHAGGSYLTRSRANTSSAGGLTMLLTVPSCKP